MNRAEKQALIDSLHEEFERSPHAVLVDFRGLSVPAVTEFRRRVRRTGSRYRVIKNTLARRAAKGTPLEAVADAFVDTTGVAYTSNDPIALAKTLVEFMKDNPHLVVKAGVVSGTQRLDAAGVKALSSMPGLAELRARLLGVLEAPAAKLVRLLSTPGGQLARVLKAHQEKLEG
jgi:large subunit ribosomal protein L10